MKVFVHTDAFPYAECMPCGVPGANGMVYVPDLQCPIAVAETLGVFQDHEAEEFAEELRQLKLSYSFAQQKFRREARELHARMLARDFSKQDTA